MKKTKIIYKQLKDFKIYYFIAFLLLGCDAFVTYYYPYILTDLIDIFLPSKDPDRIMTQLILLGTLQIISIVVASLISIMFNKMTNKFNFKIKNMIINKIKLENLNFSYKNCNNVYKEDINAEFVKNKIYLIRGRNGAGKSTLIKLITKLYDNYRGKIYFDDQDQKSFDRDTILELISTVFQNTPIFRDTIKNNILLGRECNNFEKLIDCFKLEKDLLDAGRSLDETLTEGNSLSGGQAQKLGIIRALLSNKFIYIFDEPTSNLDVESRKAFYSVLDEIKKNHIVLIISHEEKIEQFVDEVLLINKN